MRKTNFHAALVLGFAFGLAAGTPLAAADIATTSVPTLRGSDLLALVKLGEQFSESVPDASRLNMDWIVAFEENERFVYLAGKTDKALRRIVLLKPCTFVVEDRIQVPVGEGQVRWTFVSDAPEAADRGFVGQTLLPKGVTIGDSPAGLEITAATNGGEVQFLNVFRVRRVNEEDRRPQCNLTETDNGWRLAVGVANQTLKLSLPATRGAAGTIAIDAADGHSVLKERLLPSGIMPHGEEGVRLMRRWDMPYQRERMPGWDTGRVAPELKKLVEQEATKPGRAVVFGCGTGTNAIYLASKGFDVTGVDVAPTALVHADRKARETGANVRWIVADVLALPEMEPADLIFDRGCYHHVRKYNAVGYVKSVQGISRPGTRLLLLAGSVKEERRAGPPKIKEDEIRGDFSKQFTIEWLRDIRFDSPSPNANGFKAWSVLLRCK